MNVEDIASQSSVVFEINEIGDENDNYHILLNLSRPVESTRNCRKGHRP